MGAYLCIASNAVPPSVSKRIKLQVHCKYAYNFSLVDIVYFQFSVYWKKKSYSNISTTGNLYVLSISVAWFMLIYFSLSITQRHHDLPPVKFIEGNLYISYLCTLCIRIREKKRDTNKSLGGVVYIVYSYYREHTLTLHIQNKIFEIETKT